MRQIKIRNLSNPSAGAITAEYCDTFLDRLRGLMFRQSIRRDQGLVLVEKRESILDTSIHMLFMRFDIAAIWLDRNKTVVDVKPARKWGLVYQPKSPAQFVFETHIDHIAHFQEGDILSFEDA